MLIRDPYERDANFLFKAMRALRADTTLIVEILCTQEASEIVKIGTAYETLAKGQTLVDAISKEFGGVTKKNTKALLMALASGKRPPAGPIDASLVKADAERLYVHHNEITNENVARCVGFSKWRQKILV